MSTFPEVIPDHVPDLDRLLACRGLRHNTLGPTGARVFCGHLDNALGMRGRFCLLHDRPDALLPDPIVLNLFVNDQPTKAPRAACMWYPSHARRQTKEAGLGIVERKFITWDDVICDVVELANHGAEPLAVRLEAETGAAQEVTRAGRDTLAARGPACPHAGKPRGDTRPHARMLLAMPSTKAVLPHRLVCELALQPAERTSLLIALAVGLRHGEATGALKRWAQDEDPLALQQREFQQWFEDNCPTFDCPDERFTRVWWYRWFLLRHNLTTGNCPAPDARRQAQGLSPAQRRECYIFHEARQGEHTRLNLVGAPLVLQEARWLRDSSFVHDEMRAIMESPSHLAKEWLPAAMWQALQVWPEEDLTAQAADGALRHLAALREHCDPNNNLLLGGAAGPLAADDQLESGTEAVDHSAMFAASLQATAEMLALAGRELDARWHAGLAGRCRAAILEHMWDDWDHFFHDIDRSTGEPLRAPTVGGFMPFAFGLVPDEAKYARALALLVDESHFWSEHPVPQVSLSLLSSAGGPPITSSAGGSPALRAGEPAALLASGLTLPYANSLIAEAMAVAIRSHKQRHITRRRLMDFLWLYVWLQSEEDDPARLMVREAYDTNTGEGCGAYDCLQSSFNDLIIRHVAGLTPRSDGSLEVTPLVTGWDWFALHEVPYRGHRVSIIWDKRPDSKRQAQAPKGLSVYVDGDLVAQSPELERLLVPLTTSSP